MRRERSKIHSAASQPPHARRIHEEPHDVYGTRGKRPEPTACPSCGAVYRIGRWLWAEAVPLGTHMERCPACRRIADDYPAGIVEIDGQFESVHRQEIENLIRNVERRESQEHPLVRIFAIEERDGGLRVPTTDARLACAIGQALLHAYRGELTDPGPQSEEPVRIHWMRDR
jgi:NMD protein affecting ribosome stability and mRNA decay